MKRHLIVYTIMMIIIMILFYHNLTLMKTNQTINQQLQVYSQQNQLHGAYKTEDDSIYISLDSNQYKAYIRNNYIINNEIIHNEYSVDYTQKNNCVFLKLIDHGECTIVRGNNNFTLITEQKDVFDLIKFSESIVIF